MAKRWQNGGDALKTDTANRSKPRKRKQSSRHLQSVHLCTRHTNVCAYAKTSLPVLAVYKKAKTDRPAWWRCTENLKTDARRQTLTMTSESYFTAEWCACRFLFKLITQNFGFMPKINLQWLCRWRKTIISSLSPWRDFGDRRVPVLQMFSQFCY